MSGETCGWAPCETCAALTRFMEKREAGELIDRLAVTSTWWESEEADRFYARGANLPPCDHAEAQRTERAVTIIELALDQAAEPWMLGHLERAYWVWDHVNQSSFAAKLSTPLIRLELPHRGTERHAWADIGPTDAAGARLEVRLHPELLRGTIPDYSRTLDAYLLHEQVHRWQIEVLGWPWEPDLDWHGPTFRAKEAEITHAWSLNPAQFRR